MYLVGASVDRGRHWKLLRGVPVARRYCVEAGSRFYKLVASMNPSVGKVHCMWM
jgi:hypothetical protein